MVIKFPQINWNDSSEIPSKKKREDILKRTYLGLNSMPQNLRSYRNILIGN